MMTLHSLVINYYMPRDKKTMNNCFLLFFRLSHPSRVRGLKYIIRLGKRQEILNWVKASATQSRLAKLASLQEAMDNLLPFLYMRELALHRQAYQKII